MSEIEIKAQMYDLITQKDQIEYDLHNNLKSLESQSNQLKQKASVEIKPIIDKLIELQSLLNN